MVLTGGEGSAGRPRLETTRTVCRAAGAVPSSVWGVMTDRELYAAVLHGDGARFLGLAEEWADLWIRHDIACVVGDAVEGHNPGHDVCRLLMNVAVELVDRRIGRRLANYAFPLIGPPRREQYAGTAVRLRLDEGEFARKLAAAHNYAELSGEVAAAVQTAGADAFRDEWLEPVSCGLVDCLLGEPPYYERYGERQVARGRYQTILRYEAHMLPLIRHMQQALGL